MYSFYIDGEDIKKFVNLLLKENTCDKFEIRNCEISTFVNFEIDCKLNKDYLELFQEEEEIKREFCLWKELRPKIYEIIKGKIKPSKMKFVFSASESFTKKFHENAKALFLNILFDNNKILVVTGTSQTYFSLDNSLEILWENKI